MTTKDQLTQIDDWIRRGLGSKARTQIRILSKEKLPRKIKLPLATLSRRSGLSDLAVRILNPLVRPPPKSPNNSSDEEKAEYAACLTNIGGSQEAWEILKQLDGDAHPLVLLYQTFTQTTSWNYEATIPILQKYVSHPNVSGYEKLIGSINLASALVDERRYDEADSELKRVQRAAKQQKTKLLYGNSLELEAQNLINQEKWAEATQKLKEAEQVLKQTESRYSLFVEKWMAIIGILKEPSSMATRKKLASVRLKAVQDKQWETIRDCDRYHCISQRQSDLANRLYFGTPHVSFRQKLLMDFPEFSPADEFLWPVPPSETASLRVRLLLGEKTPRGSGLKVGQLSHRLLTALSSDFYSPVRLATLHAHIYPSEYYNPTSSPLRVQQAVTQLRKFFQSRKIPLNPKGIRGIYFLQSLKPCGIYLPKPDEKQDRDALLMEKLRSQINDKSFTSKQICHVLKMSPRATQYLLDRTLKKGTICRKGKGPNTHYLWAS